MSCWPCTGGSSGPARSTSRCTGGEPARPWPNEAAEAVSHAKNQRARDKAEIFETVLARVSRRVGVVARQASAELRAERIAAARADTNAGPVAGGAAGGADDLPASARRPEAEWLLVQESEPDALAELDEEELLALHGRVQRARTKYVKVYRRGASAAVAERGGRGLSHAKNQRARDKAEIFETVLARVSKRVGVVAREASAELRAERIAAARAAKDAGPATGGASGGGGAEKVPSTRRSAAKTTGGIKRDASSRAQGSRRQAAKDAR